MTAGAQDHFIENRLFEEIKVGDSASLTRIIRHDDMELFSVLSGEMNPEQLNPSAANWLAASLISTLLDTVLPGPGTIHRGQSLRFPLTLRIGDQLRAKVTVASKSAADRSLLLDCHCINQAGDTVITGTADVVAPEHKIKRARSAAVDIQVHRHMRLEALRLKVARIKPMATAIAHPCDAAAIEAAADAAQAGMIEPILVGPPAKIRRAAADAGIDITRFRLVEAPHSEAAAKAAVALVRQGEAALLMKGSLHTDELLHAVLDAESGLRTGRRLSHVYLMDVPTYPRLLLVTDAAVNIAPDLLEKRDIVQNAVDLAHIIGIPQPKVAILAAVETVNPQMQSTLDAAALCKMAERGQICGAVLDGPLAFDNAISPAAAHEKNIASPVAGQADILLVPDLEAGNMLAKQLTFLADSDAAGIILGAKVPIILTSRADSARTRISSCAVALLMVMHANAAAPGAQGRG